MKDACYLGASGDGFVSDGSGRGILECKCPAQLDKVDVSHVKPLDIGQNAKFYCYASENTLHLKKSSNHYCQVQGEMGVIGAKWCDFVVWTEAKRDNISVERIEFDEHFWEAELLLKLRNFYLEEVVPEIVTRQLQKQQLQSDAKELLTQSVQD